MKAIINGLRYDTDTAEALCPVVRSHVGFYPHDCWMYRTGGLRFFVAGKDAVFKPGATVAPLVDCIIALPNSEARKVLEREQSPEAYRVLERYFENEDA